ncbi:MAG TPA: Hsp70 family protein [Anaerolineaceae bacterium]|nr:Hsp70 family protein [Anaerolineaceae bacterium]
MSRQPVYLGIDFGTTKSAVAYLQPGQSEGKLLLIEYPPMIPSSLTLNADQKKFWLVDFGQTAKYKEHKDHALFRRFKLSLGRPSLDLPDSNPSAYAAIKPEEVAAVYLRRLRLEAKDALERQQLPLPDSVTISVPAGWDPQQKQATKYAALLAGFEDVNLCEEPLAALDHVLTTKPSLWKNLGAATEKIMVIDFGGGTCDIAVLKVSRERHFFPRRQPTFRAQVLYSHANTHLGGELVDDCILRWIKASEEAKGISLHKQHKKASAFKKNLNEGMKSDAGVVPNQHRPTSVAEFLDLKYSDELTEPIPGENLEFSANWLHTRLSKTPCIELKDQSIIKAFAYLVEKTINQCGGVEQINRIFLVGGSSHLYFVEPIVKILFPDLAGMDYIEQTAHPEEDVVLGACLHEAQRHTHHLPFKPRLFYGLSLVEEVTASGGAPEPHPTGEPARIKLLRRGKSWPLPIKEARSSWFRVTKPISELNIKIDGVGEHPTQPTLQAFKKLKTLDGSQIQPNERLWTSTQVSQDGIIKIKIVGPNNRLRMVTVEEYPLNGKEFIDRRDHFQSMFMDNGGNDGTPLDPLLGDLDKGG